MGTLFIIKRNFKASLLHMKSRKFIGFIFLMATGGYLIFIGIYFSVANCEMCYSAKHIGGLHIISPIGGLSLILFSSISIYIENKRQKELDSISKSDIINLFECSTCGMKGATHLIKIAKDQILVKQRCPTHGGRLFRLPFRLIKDIIPYIRDAMYRCYKCAQSTTVDHAKVSGRWMLIKMSCSIHKTDLPYYKIWDSVYSDIA